MGNILLVEDNEALSYSLARQFEKAGYHVIVVRSSMAALTVLDSPCGIDLVLADIVMPEGQPNGIALCRMARMKRQGIKVALMTGYDIDINSHMLPGKLYRKPVDVDCLMTEVGTLLSA
jgi:CheY-like chemotaxis protein